MRRKFRQLLQSSRGATAVEYGLICALIVVAAIGGISALGGKNGSGWGRVANEVVNAH